MIRIAIILILVAAPWLEDTLHAPVYFISEMSMIEVFTFFELIYRANSNFNTNERILKMFQYLIQFLKLLVDSSISRLTILIIDHLSYLTSEKCWFWIQLFKFEDLLLLLVFYIIVN